MPTFEETVVLLLFAFMILFVLDIVNKNWPTSLLRNDSAKQLINTIISTEQDDNFNYKLENFTVVEKLKPDILYTTKTCQGIVIKLQANRKTIAEDDYAENISFWPHLMCLYDPVVMYKAHKKLVKLEAELHETIPSCYNIHIELEEK